MKVSLTKKEILTIANKTGMFFNPNMTKSNMMQFVIAGMKGDNERAKSFANERAKSFANGVIEADKQNQRDKKLKQLGI
jgi:hypothetical protein